MPPASLGGRLPGRLLGAGCPARRGAGRAGRRRGRRGGTAGPAGLPRRRRAAGVRWRDAWGACARIPLLPGPHVRRPEVRAAHAADWAHSPGPERDRVPETGAGRMGPCGKRPGAGAAAAPTEHRAVGQTRSCGAARSALSGTRCGAPHALAPALLGLKPPFRPQRRGANGGKPLRAEGSVPGRRAAQAGTAAASHADPGPQRRPAASPWAGSKLLGLASLFRTITCRRLKGHHKRSRRPPAAGCERKARARGPQELAAASDSYPSEELPLTDFPTFPSLRGPTALSPFPLFSEETLSGVTLTPPERGRTGGGNLRGALDACSVVWVRAGSRGGEPVLRAAPLIGRSFPATPTAC
ncbi:collagen alpha-2(I) chain-like [Hyaena hyaena]|uniref:collagen alpha-2(I) chain-like n=1 Tax=Hyaena hyaena TaxID=95912 RepID=UPI0019248972|nr:collagen alpha-2(I) chain-like [Hyaena hyaena]